MPIQIQLRRGTASEWSTANPTLALGELGLETDTLKIKIGDGTTAWNSLAYAVMSLTDGSVTTAKIADGAVTTAKLADDAVTTGKIADGTIVNADVNASAAIAASKIAGTAVTQADTGTVTTTMLADSSVTSAKIADGTIVNADINSAAAIDKTKISGTAITAADTGTVTSTMIADGTIVDADINASAAIAQSKISGLTSDLAAKADLAGAAFTGAVSTTSTLAATSTVSASGLAGSLLSSATPLADGTATAGTSAIPSRQDHVHPFVSQVTTFSKSGAASVTTGTIRYRFPTAGSLLGVSAAVGTAPTGASLIVDVNKNGTTVYTTQANRPTIAVSTNAATETTPDVTSFSAGDYLTVDIDQVGSTVAGSDLTVFIRYRTP